MGGLAQTSKVNSNLGNLKIITGLITVDTNVWTLLDDNDACTLTDIGPGNVSVEFNTPFISAPVAVTAFFNATHQISIAWRIDIEAISTTSVEFRVHQITASDPPDGICDISQADQGQNDGWRYMIIGMANN